MVKIFFYTSTPYRLGNEITCTLAFSVVNSIQFQSVYSQNTLKKMLLGESDRTAIVILAALSEQELDELLLLMEGYKDIPIVLVLGDDSEKTLRKAHRFRPRFLTTIHHDYAYVLSVVEHLCRHEERTMGGLGNFAGQ